MKKGITLPVLVLVSLFSFAQVQRVAKNPVTKQKDSVVHNRESPDANSMATVNRKKLLRDLNLSKDQKINLKDAKQAGDAKKDIISNDDKLSPEQKETMLRELKRAQAQRMQAILNEEQRAKMKAMRQQLIDQRRNARKQ